MRPFLVPLVLAAYLATILLAALGATGRSAGARAAYTASLFAAWAVHLAAIVHQGVAARHFPLANVTEYLLVLGWVVLTLYLFVWIRRGVLAAGLVLPPLAAVMAVPALWISDAPGQIPHAREQALFIFHTTVSTVGMAALCLAFAMSLIYLLQDRALKSKRAPTLLKRLPSLEAVDRIGHVALLWGFPLLTLGIATGLVWSASAHGRFWSGGAKQTFPLLAWVVFAGVLYARLARGFGGRRSAYLTIAGFTLGLLTVLGML